MILLNTVGWHIFEDKKFQELCGYLSNLENIYSQKFLYKNFHLKQISGNPQDFISLKICRPMVVGYYVLNSRIVGIDWKNDTQNLHVQSVFMCASLHHQLQDYKIVYLNK